MIEEIKNEEFKTDIKSSRTDNIRQFSDFLKIEEEYLLNKIKLEEGIGKNNLLRENIFLLFVSIITKIPLIIIGKPGTGKSLSAKLMKNSMEGKYSIEKFFQYLPEVIQTYFQGSESTNPEDVENLFKIAKEK